MTKVVTKKQRDEIRITNLLNKYDEHLSSLYSLRGDILKQTYEAGMRKLEREIKELQNGRINISGSKESINQG